MIEIFRRQGLLAQLNLRAFRLRACRFPPKIQNKHGLRYPRPIVTAQSNGIRFPYLRRDATSRPATIPPFIMNFDVLHCSMCFQKASHPRLDLLTPNKASANIEYLPRVVRGMVLAGSPNSHATHAASKDYEVSPNTISFDARHRYLAFWIGAQRASVWAPSFP